MNCCEFKAIYLLYSTESELNIQHQKPQPRVSRSNIYTYYEYVSSNTMAEKPRVTIYSLKQNDMCRFISAVYNVLNSCRES